MINVTPRLGVCVSTALVTSTGEAVPASNTARNVMIQNLGTSVLGVTFITGGTPIALPACSVQDDGTSMPIILSTESPIILSGTVRAAVAVFNP